MNNHTMQSLSESECAEVEGGLFMLVLAIFALELHIWDKFHP